MKYINQLILLITSIVAMLFLFSCGHEHTEGDGHNHGAEHSEHDGHNHSTENEGHSKEDGHGDEHEEGEIHLTKEQVKTMNIAFGDFSQIKINDFVKATGTLGLPPNALTSVSAKSDGFIKNSKKYVEGSYVKQGSIMAYLENPEFIEHQREYLEVAAELVYDRQELARHRTLVAEKAGVEKNIQKFQAEVNRKVAILKGISKRLAYLGIDIDNLTTENIIQRVPIYSPASGYITSIQMHNGMYVTPQIELMEIVNENHLHLELDIFEKDISKVKEGQEINYSIPAMGNEIYKGEVHIIGKEFNTENKTVRIHGHLEKKRSKFIKDLFVEAKIWLNDETVQALPEKAIIKDGAASYIYVTNGNAEREEIKFEPIRVMPSNTDKGFTAVKLIDAIPKGMKIVTEGAYYVYAQSKVGELEHSH